MSIPENPDLVAADALEEVLKTLTVVYPDGGTEDFGYVEMDVGYVSKPSRFPYVSIHTGPARGSPARLGRGDQEVSYDIEVDCVISIEHEDTQPKLGYRRATQIRWAVWRHLVRNRQFFRDRGIEFTNIKESSLNYLTDDGSFLDWGFTGVVYQPVTVKFRGV